MLASTSLLRLMDLTWEKFRYMSVAAGSITASSRVSISRKRLLLLQKPFFFVIISTSNRLALTKNTRANVKMCQAQVKRCRANVNLLYRGQSWLRLDRWEGC